MGENTEFKSPAEVIPSTRGSMSAVASSHAPFLYFENAPLFGHLNGTIRITLEAARDLHGPSGEVTMDRVVVAHLRMNIPAARSLKAAIEGALLLALPAPSGSSPGDPPSKPN